MNIYESDEWLAQYLEFHYGEVYLETPNYPKACCEILLDFISKNQRKRVLDLGCAVGRTSFELTKVFDNVIGIDLSRRFIDTAQTLQMGEMVEYSLCEEGEWRTAKKVSLSDMGLFSDKNNYDPRAFLQKIGQRIQPDGLLVITSPYTWLEEFTPRVNWLGGFLEDGRPLSTFEGLSRELKEGFTCLEAPIQIPFVIRETRRKFQHSFAEMTLWKKK